MWSSKAALHCSLSLPVASRQTVSRWQQGQMEEGHNEVLGEDIFGTEKMVGFFQ